MDDLINWETKIHEAEQLIVKFFRGFKTDKDSVDRFIIEFAKEKDRLTQELHHELRTIWPQSMQQFDFKHDLIVSLENVLIDLKTIEKHI